MSLKTIALSTSVLAGLAVSAAAISPAAAQDSGIYIQGHGGANFIVQDDVDFDAGEFGTFSGSYDADTGWLVGGALGKSFTDAFRGDIELTYRSNGVGNFEFDDPDLDEDDLEFDGDEDVTSTAVMLNAYYDFLTGNDAYTPYIGAGIGYANVDIGEEDEGAFAYQAKAGIARNFANSQIGVEGTYFATSDVEFEDDLFTADVEYGATSVQVFFRQFL